MEIRRHQKAVPGGWLVSINEAFEAIPVFGENSKAISVLQICGDQGGVFGGWLVGINEAFKGDSRIWGRHRGKSAEGGRQREGHQKEVRQRPRGRLSEGGCQREIIRGKSSEGSRQREVVRGRQQREAAEGGSRGRQ